ncbi:MAG: ABC transporter ATP-binding protein [Abitibacteriaceae bacterium]|nr:ABC transporter ATP-binding protein [Abditibacteriaceae bacterium]
MPLMTPPAISPASSLTPAPNDATKAADNIIYLNGVAKSYMAEGRMVNALQGVNLDVPRGQFLAIVGRSGCGKSTLLNLLGGLDKPSTGKVQVNGLDLAHLNEAQLTQYRRDVVGIIFQFFNLLPLLSVLENTALPALLAGQEKRKSHARAAELLNAVGLGERMQQQASLLSGGEMQRVAVARALINDPQLILADEPTGNLDSKSAEPVLNALYNLTKQENKTVVMVTHSREAAAIADVTREMRDGKFV